MDKKEKIEDTEVETTNVANDDLEIDQKKLEARIVGLSLKEFNKVLNTIFKDTSLSDVEKMIVAKDLHRISKRDFSYDTIGKILGISKVGALKVERRALKKLQKEMKKSGLSMADFE